MEESRLEQPAATSDGDRSLQPSREATDHVLMYVFRNGEGLPLASLAVVTRILELSTGNGDCCEVLEMFVGRWATRLTELLVLLSSHHVSAVDMQPGRSSLDTGTLEHHRRKESCEFYWTTLALSGLMKFLGSRSLPLDDAFVGLQNSESLVGSILLHSSQCWSTKK